MKISKIQLINFKRFTDLQILDVPESAKLVLLIGSNGSGKSSLFDSFGFVNNAIKNDVAFNEEFWSYFTKGDNNKVKVAITFNDNTELILDNSNYWPPENLKSNLFYGRTSFRQIPKLTRKSLGQGGRINFEKDSDRPKLFIEKDNRFENDIEKITEIILKEIFRSDNSKEQVKERYINPINDALKNIFGDEVNTRLELLEIIPPLEGKVAQITFRKGSSEFHYNYLSAGEKEVFNLFVNLLSRGSLYQDSVYFLDEIDLHLNTKLQFNLIKELTENWIPDNCQLWTASHSLGFIDYANKSESAILIDFDSLDFDVPVVLTPEPKDNSDVYDIAVGKEFLPVLFKDLEVFFVENKDKEYYATIGIERTVFISANNRNSVYHKVRSTEYKGIVDRDFLSDSDISEIKNQYNRLYILGYYSIENYMYHPDNLEEYYTSEKIAFNKNNYIKDLTKAKNEVKQSIILDLITTRLGYPYFTEPEYNGKPNQNRFKNKSENKAQAAEISKYLDSDDLETFYKALPMKTYCTGLLQRQNIAKSDLTKTNWFQKQIENLLATEV
jgi:predicted ATP-binding protein involved in virulence